ncbi:hypothetical protein [Paenibacillus sp. S150]|uniref:hypothetical protein n=1 Tax=Paenibacillus sp. S150 TaxID=2749826 RepID=UPI001C57CA8C|nr:hypothetical protein [Paenibacillus sp. S150]MBW4083274.1 hypothetical protein [Paenibacillus sp. S150]
MIKNRSFMLGLGAGLILGALLLQLMISGGASPLTKEQLIKEAARLNLTVAETAEGGTEPEEVNSGQSSQEDPQASETELPAASSQPPASPEASGVPSPAAAAEPSAAAGPEQPSAPGASAAVLPPLTAPPVSAPSTPEAAAGTLSVRIPTGATLSETADLLAEAGVIRDKAEFLKIANSRKANTRIQYGGYSFTGDESLDSIIDKLITVR